MTPVNVPAPSIPIEWKTPSRGIVGMYSLIAAEAAVFTIFVTAYVFYLGKSISGPQPRDLLHVPVFFTVCLLSSSVTIHLAVKMLDVGNLRAFGAWWFSTVALGAMFLFGTASEWHHLIYDENFTIRTSLFGTTYYSLVGLHALHVTVGLLALTAVWIFNFLGLVEEGHAERVAVLSLYWHFVDAVWVVVFIVVYGIGR